MEWGFSSQNSPKDLVPSYKMALDLWYCFGKGKAGIIAKRKMWSCLVVWSILEGKEPCLIAKENAVVLNH